MTYCCSVKAVDFVKVLSQETRWFLLGVHLDIPPNKLKEIEKNHGNDLSRCLIELHEFLEKKNALTWEAIASALKGINNNTLADKILTEYIRVQPLRSEVGTAVAGVANPMDTHSETTAIEEVLVVSESIILKEFHDLNKRLARLVLQIKDAFGQSKASHIGKIQDLALSFFGIPRLPKEQATNDAVFDQILEECSILNFEILEDLAAESSIMREDLLKDISSLKSAADSFKSSVKMDELVGAIKGKQVAATGCTRVKLKVQEFWRQFRMKQFEVAMNEILETLYERLSHITVGKGCICVNWTIPPGVNYRKLLPKKSPEFLQLIGVIYLHIGDDVIYSNQSEAGYDTLEAAMQQAIKLKNTRAIKLLRAVSCSPEAVRGTTVKLSSVNRGGVTGVAHAKPTVSPNKEAKHSSCKKKEKRQLQQPALHQQKESCQKKRGPTAGRHLLHYIF